MAFVPQPQTARAYPVAVGHTIKRFAAALVINNFYCRHNFPSRLGFFWGMGAVGVGSENLGWQRDAR